MGKEKSRRTFRERQATLRLRSAKDGTKQSCKEEAWHHMLSPDPVHHIPEPKDDLDSSKLNDIPGGAQLNGNICADEFLRMLSDSQPDFLTEDQEIIDCLSSDIVRGFYRRRTAARIAMEDFVLSLSTPRAPKDIIEDDYSEDSMP